MRHRDAEVHQSQNNGLKFQPFCLGILLQMYANIGKKKILDNLKWDLVSCFLCTSFTFQMY